MENLDVAKNTDDLDNQYEDKLLEDYYLLLMESKVMKNLGLGPCVTENTDDLNKQYAFDLLKKYHLLL